MRYIATTKKEFERLFRQDYLPAIREQEKMQAGRGIDVPMRSEVWYNMTDALVSSGELPKRALTWSCPW